MRRMDARLAGRRDGRGAGDMGRQAGGRHRGVLGLLVALMALFAAAAAGAATADEKGRPLKLVALGDSLTAGYQLPAAAAFPAVLERTLRAKGYDVSIANAGVSGDTTTGGLDRLDWSVPEGTDGVILELGANDMLRGTDPEVPRKALDTIVSRLKARGIPVLLAGMRASANLGPDYVAKFDAIYPTLAERYGLVLYPFFLEGVAGEASLALPDRLHPNAKGVEGIVAGILPTVEIFLRRLQGAER
ncbi:arylesterase [Methylobacterium jeotgali]